MKIRALVALVVLLAAGAAALWYFRLRDGAAPPPLAASLDAAHTLAFAASDGYGRRLEAARAAAAAAGVASGELKLGELAFDAFDAAAWRSIGVDLDAGVAVTVDARLRTDAGPAPVLLIRLADPAAAREALARIAPGVEVTGDATSPGQIGEARLGPVRVLAGRLGDRLALVRAPGGDDLDRFRTAFGELLVEGPRSLAASDALRQVFAGAEPGAGLHAYADVMRLVAARVWVVPDGFAERFPALGLTIGPTGARLEVAAAADGAQALRRLFTPAGEAPRFGAFVPEGGWAVARAGLDLRDLPDLLAQVGPGSSAPAIADAVSAARAGLVTFTSVTFEQLAAAFDGHVAVALDLGTLVVAQQRGAEVLDGLLMAGVADIGEADAVLGRLGTVGAGILGLTRREVEIAGLKAQVFERDGWKFAVVRARDVVLVAPNEASLGAALGRPDGRNLAGSPAGEALAADASVAAVVDLAPLLPVLGTIDGEAKGQDAGLVRIVRAHAAWKRFSEAPRLTLRVDIGEAGLAATTGDAGVAQAAADVALALLLPRLVGELVVKGKRVVPTALLGQWGVDFEALADADDFRDMPEAQRRSALEMARQMLGSLTFEFTDETYRVSMTDRQEEGAYTVRSITKTADGEQIVLDTRGQNGQHETLEATVKGDRIFVKAGQDRFPLRRR